MKLPQTKFNIGDYVATKGSFDKKLLTYCDTIREVQFFQVSEISSITCYIGTQIFYDVKPLAISYWPNIDYESKQKFLNKTFRQFSINRDHVEKKRFTEAEIEGFNPDKLPQKILKPK